MRYSSGMAKTPKRDITDLEDRYRSFEDLKNILPSLTVAPARYGDRMCPNCHRRLDDDNWRVCPYCHRPADEPCHWCGATAGYLHEGDGYPRCCECKGN